MTTTKMTANEAAIQAAANAIPDLTEVDAEELKYPCVKSRLFQYWDDTRTTFRWVTGLAAVNHKGHEIAWARLGYDKGDNVPYMQMAVARWESAHAAGAAWGKIVTQATVQSWLHRLNAALHHEAAEYLDVLDAVRAFLFEGNHEHQPTHTSAWIEGAADAIMARGLTLRA